MSTRPRLQDRVTQERRGKWVASRGREAREESSVIRGVGSVSPKAARCSRMEGGGWQKRGKRVGGWKRVLVISRFRTPFHGQSSARSASRVLLPLLLLFFSFLPSLLLLFPLVVLSFSLSLSVYFSSNRLALDTIRVEVVVHRRQGKLDRVGSEVLEASSLPPSALFPSV